MTRLSPVTIAHAAGLEITTVDGASTALVDDFLAGSLDPGSLRDLRFRAADGMWMPHPQVAFADATFEPQTPLPDADLAWQQTITSSPCGELTISHTFTAGAKEVSRFGSTEAAEVRTTMDYRVVLSLMAGELTTLEAFEQGGQIEGEWSAMALLSGLAQQPEFEAALEAAVGDLAPALHAVEHGRGLT